MAEYQGLDMSRISVKPTTDGVFISVSECDWSDWFSEIASIVLDKPTAEAFLNDLMLCVKGKVKGDA